MCLDFDHLLQDLEALPEDTVVLMQPCGHNPTGIDPSKAQWQRILQVFQKKPRLFPFFDTAYFGFASG